MRSCFKSDAKPLTKGKKQKAKSSGPGGPQAQPLDTNRSASLRKLSSSLSAFLNALTDYDDYFESKTYLDIRSFQVEVLVCFLHADLIDQSADHKLRHYLKLLHISVSWNRFNRLRIELIQIQVVGLTVLRCLLSSMTSSRIDFRLAAHNFVMQ